MTVNEAERAYLTSSEARKIIQENLDQNIHELALQKTWNHKPALIQQIALLQKAKKKLPSFYKCASLLTSRAYEQASSEALANYKAGLMSGNKVLDLCGGLGVDAWAISQNAEITSLEPNEELFHIRAFNFEALGASSIQNIHSSAESYLESAGSFDLAYFDPDRRDGSERKLSWDDYQPPFFETLEKLKNQIPEIWIKLSPMTDFREVLNKINHCTEIHFIAEKNEMKELLVKVEPGQSKSCQLISVNIHGDQIQSFSREDLLAEENGLTEDQEINYLYLVPVSFKVSRSIYAYCKRHNIYMFHQQSELIGSAEFEKNHDKSFKVIYEGDKKEMKTFLKKVGHRKAAIYSFNCPDSQEEISKQFGLKHSNSFRLFIIKTGLKMQYYYAEFLK